MAGAVGAGQAAGHLGAEQGRHGDAEPLGQGGHIKAGEVEHLLDRRCLHQLLEQGRLGLPPGDADAADVVLVVADLYQTQAVATVHQPHGLGIHRQGFCGPQEAMPLGREVAIEHGKAGRGGAGGGGHGARSNCCHGRGSGTGAPNRKRCQPQRRHLEPHPWSRPGNPAQGPISPTA